MFEPSATYFQAILFCDIQDFREQLPLAEVAPVDRVIGEALYIELLRHDHPVLDPDLLCKIRRLAELPLRIGR